MTVAIWSIHEDKPVRLEQRRDWVEAHLEAWVKADPSMVAEGLTWVGQQVVLPDRSRLDLVGLTREGGLVVAELKRGVVGIATLAQALHYVLWLAAMDPETLVSKLKLDAGSSAALNAGVQADGGLDIAVLLIGTGRSPELDRAAEFLSAKGLNVPVRIVTFTPFEDAKGQVLLARATEDHELAPEDTTPRQRSSRGARIEWVLDLARNSGVQDVFDTAMAMATGLSLNVKPWPKSITVVPPFTRGRTLVYLGPRTHGQVHFGFGEEALIELYAADKDDLWQRLGPNWVDIPATEALARLQRFREMMESLQAANEALEHDVGMQADASQSPLAEGSPAGTS